MVVDWEGLAVGGGGDGDDGGKNGEGSDDFGVRGRWTESQEDRGGGGMLELRREGAEWQRGAGRRSTLLNVLDARQREKGGEGAAWCHVGAGVERRGRG
jgi:hypothetical protein